MLKQCFYVISQRKIFEIEAFDRYYEGRNVTVVASRNIEAGEEIENCYGVDWRQDFYLRQNQLKTQYGFNCACLLCRVEAKYPISFSIDENKLLQSDNFKNVGEEILQFFKEKSDLKFSEDFSLLAEKLFFAQQALSRKFLQN